MLVNINEKSKNRSSINKNTEKKSKNTCKTTTRQTRRKFEADRETNTAKHTYVNADLFVAWMENQSMKKR